MCVRRKMFNAESKTYRSPSFFARERKRQGVQKFMQYSANDQSNGKHDVVHQKRNKAFLKQTEIINEDEYSPCN